MKRNSKGPVRRTRAGLTAFAVGVAAVAGAPVAVGQSSEGLGSPRAFTTAVSGPASDGRINAGRPCADGGFGASWHHDAEGALPPGVITGPDSELVGSLRLHLDVHSDDHTIRADPEPAGGDGTSAAWLQGTESFVSLANQRGTVRMRLRSVPGAIGGACDTDHSLDFDGLHVNSRSATPDKYRWEITDSSGSYRQAEGSGTFSVAADVAPGADNPWTLGLTGDVAVLQPDLEVDVSYTYWGFLGLHYALRYVSVVYEVTNAGPGDAFDVRLEDAFSPTVGVALVGPLAITGGDPKLLGPVPQVLGDLSEGESARVVLRWKLPLPSGDPPCQLVILGCEFDTTLQLQRADALDVVGDEDETSHAVAPNLPPPL